MLIKPRFNIRYALAAVNDRCFAGQPTFANPNMIIKFHFQRRAPHIERQHAGERSAHCGVSQAIGHAAMGGLLGTEMLLSVNINRHNASAIAALDHFKAQRARKCKIGIIASQLTPQREISGRAVRQMAAAAADGGCRVVIALDRHGHNVRRNKGSQG